MSIRALQTVLLSNKSLMAFRFSAGRLFYCVPTKTNTKLLYRLFLESFISLCYNAHRSFDLQKDYGNILQNMR